MAIPGRYVLLAYRAGAAASKALPLAALSPVSRALGSVLARTLPEKRAVVERNMQRVLGPGAEASELEKVVIRAFVSYVHYWMESFRLPTVPPERYPAYMTCEGWDNVEEGVRRGKGVILALPHLGSWDYAGAWMATIGYPMTVVAEPLEPPELFDWFVKLREDLGLSVVRLGDAATSLLRALDDNRVVGLLMDRDLVGNGVQVELFGEKTTLPAGPAVLALRSGAALLPTAVFALPREQHVSVVRPPIDLERRGSFRSDVARITQDLAHGLEALISRAPEQWHLFQPNWPSDWDSGAAN